jgi:uncharacterized protein
MSGRLVYLDSSAFVKLVMLEAETAALVAYLRRWSVAVSASLLRTEALRAAMRHSQVAVGETRLALRDVAFIDIDRDLLDRAGIVPPPDLRSLDALHVATALSLGDDLDEVVAYDRRMVTAARAAGLVVTSPA